MYDYTRSAFYQSSRLALFTASFVFYTILPLFTTKLSNAAVRSQYCVNYSRSAVTYR